MKPFIGPLRFVYDRILRMPSAHRRAILMAYGPAYRAWCRSNLCEEVTGRFALYRHILEREGLTGPIDYIEFGVYRGDTIQWWVENNRCPESTFVGFDCFEGLPEDFETIPKGTFTTDGEIPQIPDPRCQFVKGFFKDTVPGWVAGRELSRRTVVHLDADLYSSTLLALVYLLPKLKANDILIFDEFDSYINEYRALCDATQACPREYRVIGRTPKWAQASLMLT
jgi:O-methyltransferase